MRRISALRLSTKQQKVNNRISVVTRVQKNNLGLITSMAINFLSIPFDHKYNFAENAHCTNLKRQLNQQSTIHGIMNNSIKAMPN